MNWLPDLTPFSGPKYKTLADAIEASISDGSLAAGARLPTHRSLADHLGVTIGTVTRGYAEAERRRLVTARVGSGTFVLGKVWEKRDFSVPESTETDLIDFSLSLPVPARRESILANSLGALSSDPKRLAPLLEYLPETGIPAHRQAMVRWMRYHGMDADADNILITSGGQHANMLALQGLLKPGDIIASEGLTYPGFVNAARQWQLRHIGLEMDDQGLLPDALESCCRTHQPRLLYLTPNLQNPTAGVMGLERRKAILAIAAQYNLLILEDDVQFIPANQRLPSLYSLNPKRVIYTSSFSKHLAGGLRVGFACAPADLIMKLRIAMRNNCWISPALMSEIAAEWIDSGEAFQLVDWQTQAMATRYQLLQEQLGHLQLTSQPYGFHAWLQLPEPWRAETFVRQLEARHVKVLQAELFAVGSTAAPQAVRICISSPSSLEQLKQGLVIIRELLAQEPTTIMRPMVL